jgi:hypothetical protein
MLTRFAATKDAIELKSIEIINDRPKGFVIKKDNDFKGIHFDLVWEHTDENIFKLICFHKGTFNVAADEFKELIEYDASTIIATIMLKELFAVTYISDPLAKPKDIVYTDEIKYKYIDLFQDQETMHFYVSKLAEVIGWELQIQKPGHDTWENFII